ncbi:Alpha-1,2-mannosyltransferase MNN23 [Fulvia fulva]|uniref:Alpha-1,2-mannosyltransferase MNN23 n=1 Tax=Passalora fulva TaxID=5499 RepID=A0A9Q8L736_PASFU|nr:Alpha-1,2-mannosyltransferase MNN23 [Fulvia fulva]KAK4635221.1 Alpha-1,2-mannosyltransferase MNN23 [Fulvia fulva]KAK4636749.1 Alpha-1,2-mannosyltransferase MNN23 [Fulvia fulva]UJO12063.1 Alpha-1,2-mannosyltransferase MNN23 [Fulvia fulva]WPV08581.1 Alpha-1,2-mannosyltransferase MNN23 [Fulvia fulva]WPV23325.1 Alpha-1,2-mannosyltransferase MNN23 [Fulvia fulva]
MTAADWSKTALPAWTRTTLPKRTHRVGLLAVLSALVVYVLFWPSSIPDDRGVWSKTEKQWVDPPVAPDAHRLRMADDFWPHFQNVTRMRGISMAEAKSGCTWPDSERKDINFQFGENSGWGLDLSWVKHDRSDSELKRHRARLHDYLTNGMIPYEEYAENFHGRGLVILAGDGRSLKRMHVILKQLKRLGCTLPIEFHYYGNEQTHGVQDELSKSWDVVYFNDLAGKHNIFPVSYNLAHGIHYQMKNAAMLNSRFEEPFLLDSDNVPVVNPESLWESDLYKEYGTIFWPDIARTRYNNPIWGITNTKCRMDEYEQESGQLLVNKRKFWYHLQLALWFCEPVLTGNDHYFGNILLGDKDTFRFAWHALKTKYGYPSKWLSTVGTLSDGFFCGHTFGQYHPDGQLAFLHGGTLKTMPGPVIQWQKEGRGGIFQYYQKSIYEERHEFHEKIGLKFDGHSYMPEPKDGMPAGWCSEMPDVEPRPFDELVPGWNDVFDELGGYWMIYDTSNAPIHG